MTVAIISSISLFLSYTVLIIYYRQSWLAIPDFTPHAGLPGQTGITKPKTRISVIIPARNEAQNILACLDAIAAQSYPKEMFEVIVVDDHSTDNTATLVRGYALQNITCISLEDIIKAPLNSYKKKAIEVAIGRSTGSLIITTDADCIVPENWLLTIASFYETYKPAFIAAPVSIQCSNRFIEIFQSLDFMTLQGITGAAVHKRFHMMCNGANLAYEKVAFDEVDGFAGIQDIASGDDMLLMHKIYKQHPHRVMFLRSKEAIVQTAPVSTVSEFFNQRIRWASKADKYQDRSMLPVLLLVYLFNLALLLLPLIELFDHKELLIINYQLSIIQFWLILLVLKTIIELFFLYPVAKFFDKQKLLWWFPVMQPFHIIYTVIAGFLGKFGHYTWKERRVK